MHVCGTMSDVSLVVYLLLWIMQYLLRILLHAITLAELIKKFH